MMHNSIVDKTWTGVIVPLMGKLLQYMWKVETSSINFEFFDWEQKHNETTLNH